MEPHGETPESLPDIISRISERFFGSDASASRLPVAQHSDAPDDLTKNVSPGTRLTRPHTGHGVTQPKSDADKLFDILRPELNISRHADLIFAPSHAKNLNKPVSRTWVETLADGTKVKASIMVEPYNGKRPTTKTKKIFYALQSIYERKGLDHDERTVCSLREIAKASRIKWQGKSTAREIRREGLQLRLTPLHFKQSFQLPNGERITLEEPINILDSFRITTRDNRKSNEFFISIGSFRYNEYIRNNLKANRTKPINYDVIFQIKGELASVVYAHLDVVLSDKSIYMITTKKLFENLHFEGEKEYRYPSGRKRKLERVVKELNGKQISTGVLTLRIEKTMSGKDYKLVATKTSSITHARRSIPEHVEPANPPEARPLLMQDIKNGIPYHRNDRDRLFERIIDCYDAELIYRALSENRTDGRHAKHPVRYFLAILHRLAHSRGQLWLWKRCPKTCKHYPPHSKD
jgi:hypothetical protein